MVGEGVELVWNYYFFLHVCFSFKAFQHLASLHLAIYNNNNTARTMNRYQGQSMEIILKKRDYNNPLKPYITEQW